MPFCQNPAIDKIPPEELSSKQSHFICSQHFSELDYNVKSGATQVRLKTSAIPKLLGPCILAGDGTLISPTKPPSNEFAAQMIGLKPLAANDNDEEDDEDRWQYEHYEETSNEVTAAFVDSNSKLEWPIYLKKKMTFFHSRANFLQAKTTS